MGHKGESNDVDFTVAQIFYVEVLSGLSAGRGHLAPS